jgi:hypothetical protein
MSKFLSIVAALGLLVVSAPAFAQKESCEAYCVNRCASANSKNYCMSQCVPQCNQIRSKSK